MGQGTLSFSKEKPRPEFKLLTGGQKMNIKSLLLGSAAALVAVSGARAADAVVVAEPEPMEYVRVCDVYGSGFYYMPGTETCLKISGYVRVDVRGGELFEQHTLDHDDPLGFPANHDNTYSNRARFQLRADARSETELGTLRAYAAVNFNYQAVGSGVFVDNADVFSTGDIFIELGGFRIGRV